jgi:hypothetical protein
LADEEDSSNLVFIAWSGETSYQVARELHGWIPNVLQANPWMSEEDIERGSRWNPALASKLEKANFGIICLTPENLDKPWLLFEAGALSKALSGYVWTLLFGLKKSDVTGPLSQFQHTLIKKEDFRKLMQTINKAMGTKYAITDNILNKAFETSWKELEINLKSIVISPESRIKERSEREILEEILDLIREFPRQLQSNFIKDSEWIDRQQKMLNKEVERLQDHENEVNRFNTFLKQNAGQD